MSSQKERGGQATPNGPRMSKPLFSEDEKVLCYEPDQKKAQVLYDSKVMEVVEKKDGHGKAHFEYKIHFQGWKSSWDRHVREDNVLKDTEENRNLQRELNEQAQLLNKTSIRKKKKKTILEKLKAASLNAKDSNNASKSSNFSRGENTHQSSGTEKDTTDQDSSEEDDDKSSIEVEIPTELMDLLNTDFWNLSKHKMLSRLPTELSVVKLLEQYVRHVGRTEILAYMEWKNKLPTNVPSTITGTTIVPSGKLGGKLVSKKIPSSTRSVTDIENEEVIKTFQRINFAKKIAEDVRIMFDFMISQILLYECERDQYNDFLKGRFRRQVEIQPAIANSASLPEVVVVDHEQFATPIVEGPPTKRRKTESGKNLGGTSNENNPSTSKSCVSSMQVQGTSKNGRRECELRKQCVNPWACEQLNNFMDEMINFQLVPEELEALNEYPSLCYGIVHLLRLFVKMPGILSKTSFSRKKLKLIVRQLNNILIFLLGMPESYTNHWYLPTKVYEEDSLFGERTTHNLPKKVKQITSSGPIFQGNTSSNDSTRKKTSSSAGPRAVPLPKRVKAETLTTRRKTLIQDAAATPLTTVKVEQPDNQFERPIKRNQRRVTTGRIDSIMIDGNALGVRKSLSIEELSRETLVAASNPNKQYSLRMHCRIPYK